MTGTLLDSYLEKSRGSGEVAAVTVTQNLGKTLPVLPLGWAGVEGVWGGSSPLWGALNMRHTGHAGPLSAGTGTSGVTKTFLLVPGKVASSTDRMHGDREVWGDLSHWGDVGADRLLTRGQPC